MVPQHRKSPGLEQLETRLTPAGNVTATLIGGQLNVLGDAAANAIRVTQSATTLTILGQAGTTVNGAASVSFATTDQVQAEFKMEGGNDHIFLIAMRISNDLVADMGDGNDLVEVSNVRTGANCDILGGLGDDLFGVANTTVGGDMNNEFGEGVATLFLTRLNVAKNLSVVTSDGNDRLSIDGGITVGEDATIETGKGDDIVTVADLVTAAPVNIGKGLTISTDEGNDRINLVRVVTGEDINIEAGKGNDRILLDRVTTAKSLAVNTDDGDDNVTATAVHAAADAVFTGGAGTDTLDDNGITAGIKKEVKEFEVLL